MNFMQVAKIFTTKKQKIFQKSTSIIMNFLSKKTNAL